MIKYKHSLLLAVAVAIIVPAITGTASAAERAEKTGKKTSSQQPAPASCAKRLAFVKAFEGDLKEMIEYSYGTRYNNSMDPSLVKLREFKLPNNTKVTAKTGKVLVDINGAKKERANYPLYIQRYEESLPLLKQKTNTAELENVLRALSASNAGAKKSAEDMLAQWNRVNKDANCNNKAEAAKVKELSKKRSAYRKQFYTERIKVAEVTKNASKAYQAAAKDYKKKAAAERKANRNQNVTGGALAPSN